MEIWRGRVLWRGYVHSHTHPHTQLKMSGIPHTHTHTQSMRDSRQNGDGFGQYPRKRVYLPSLLVIQFLFRFTPPYLFSFFSLSPKNLFTFPHYTRRSPPLFILFYFILFYLFIFLSSTFSLTSHSLTGPTHHSFPNLTLTCTHLPQH